MSALLRDFRFAVRTLRRRPSFTIVVVLTLALGLGANTAIFGVVYGLILQPLGYPEEPSLVALASVNAKEGGEHRGNFLPDFWYWREQAKSFESLNFFGWWSITLQDQGRAERVESVLVSSDVFGVLGIQPVVGRLFTPEDEVPRRGTSALVSFGLWDRMWGQDPSIVGKTVRLDGLATTIVGVLPAGTALPSPEAELWLPVGYFEAYAQSEFSREERQFVVVGKLREGTRIEQSQSEMDAIAESLSGLFPATNTNWGVEVFPLREFLVGDAREPVLLAFGAAALILLIGVANIANLLLARSMGRQRELALRRALGAGTGRLWRQQVTEGIVLALPGGLLGLLIGSWLFQVVLATEPGILPRSYELALGWPVVLSTVLAAVLTGVLFGSFSTFFGPRRLESALRSGSGHLGGARGQSRLRYLLAGAEMTLALVLLSGAGILIDALWGLEGVDPGFDPANTYAAHLVLNQEGYAKDMSARAVFFRSLAERIRSIPGVEKAALSTSPPAPGLGVQMQVPYEGADGPSADAPGAPQAALRVVTPGYFETVRLPVMAGRDIADSDRAGNPLVALVNQTLANRAFRERSPVGRKLSIFAFGETLTIEVIGVVGDTRFAGLDVAPRPAFFLAHEQIPFMGMSIVARTRLPEADFSRALTEAIGSLDSGQAAQPIRSLERRLASSIGTERFYSVLLALFAIVALTLASAGTFGVLAYWVRQRYREIGLRMALGAQPPEVVTLLLRQVGSLSLGAIAAGSLGTYVVSQLLAGTFRSVEPSPLVFLLAASVLGAASLVACIIPARQAARIEPTAALRID